MIDHKKIIKLMSIKLQTNKIEFSKSNRKGDKSLWVCKVLNGDGVREKLVEMVDSGETEGWSVFSSRDGNTSGLQILVG